MGYAELISKLEALPHDKQTEVIDFVEFLSARCNAATFRPRTQTEWSDVEFSELAMRQAPLVSIPAGAPPGRSRSRSQETGWAAPRVSCPWRGQKWSEAEVLGVVCSGVL